MTAKLVVVLVSAAGIGVGLSLAGEENAIGPVQVAKPEKSVETARALAFDAAQTYMGWKKSFEGFAWAPELCRDAPVSLSHSGDTSTHGQKLYHLYVKDLEDYHSVFRALDEGAAPNSVQPAKREQVLVKQTWHAVEAAEQERFNTARGADGKLYARGERGPLFMMIKVGDADTAGTDAGWMYATLTPDGDAITAIGALASCMECHQNARHDRMFGPIRPDKLEPDETSPPSR